MMEEFGVIVENVLVDFFVYIGEDFQSLVVKEIGGVGVILVVSYIYGDEMMVMFSVIDQGEIVMVVKY